MDMGWGGRVGVKTERESCVWERESMCVCFGRERENYMDMGREGGGGGGGGGGVQDRESCMWERESKLSI